LLVCACNALLVAHRALAVRAARASSFLVMVCKYLSTGENSLVKQKQMTKPSQPAGLNSGAEKATEAVRNDRLIVRMIRSPSKFAALCCHESFISGTYHQARRTPFLGHKMNIPMALLRSRVCWLLCAGRHFSWVPAE
jgi:hypothetical protein